MTKDNEDNNKIGVLYNACYGGFSISQFALDEFNRRNKLQNQDAIHISQYYNLENCRTNLLLIEIYQEFGEKFNRHYSEVQLEYIHSKYANFYEISEYDGLERIVINYDAYIVNEIKNIIKNNDFNDIKKVFEIELLLRNTV